MTEILTRNVKLRTSLAGPMGSAGPGAVVSVDETAARLLVEQGAASYSDAAPTVTLAASAAAAPQPGRYDLIQHAGYAAANAKRAEFGRLLVAARHRQGSAAALIAVAAEAQAAALAGEAELLLGGDAAALKTARGRAAEAQAAALAAEQQAAEAEHEEAVLTAALVRLDGQIERLRGEARRAMAAAARADHELAMARFVALAVRLGEAHSALLDIQGEAIAALGDSGGGGIRAIRWSGLGTAADPNSILSAWIQDLDRAGYKLEQEVADDAN